MKQAIANVAFVVRGDAVGTRAQSVFDSETAISIRLDFGKRPAAFFENHFDIRHGPPVFISDDPFDNCSLTRVRKQEAEQ